MNLENLDFFNFKWIWSTTMKIYICFFGLRGYTLWGFEEGTKIAFRIPLNITVWCDLEIMIVPKMIFALVNNIFLAWVLLMNWFPWKRKSDGLDVFHEQIE